jgi:photosystem II stability/assembly factor-like uncharacterized protein
MAILWGLTAVIKIAFPVTEGRPLTGINRRLLQISTNPGGDGFILQGDSLKGNYNFFLTSIDSGHTWVQSEDTLPRRNWCVDWASQTVYATLRGDSAFWKQTGGGTWERLPALPFIPASFSFSPRGSRGMAADMSGGLWTTSNGGAQWQRVIAGTAPGAVVADSAGNAREQPSGNAITPPGKNPPSPQGKLPTTRVSYGVADPPPDTARSVNPVPFEKLVMHWESGYGLALGDGSAWETLDGGAHWSPLLASMYGRPVDGAVLGDSVWVLMQYDEIAQRFDGGTGLVNRKSVKGGKWYEGKRAYWPADSAGESACVHVLDWQKGEMLSNSPSHPGLLLKSVDFGRHWRPEPVLVVSRLPLLNGVHQGLHLLLGLSLLVVIGLVGVRYDVRKHMGRIEHQLVENPLTVFTDNPSAKDALGFGPTRNAILSLINNPDTKPPVSIVLNGSWGSGKSSLMMQLKKELDGDGRYFSIWFNVWHFQAENHLLSVFLSSILAKCEKEYGLAFRARLFYQRYLRMQFPAKMAFWFGVCMILPLVLYVFLLLLDVPPVRTFFQTHNELLFGYGNQMALYDLHKFPYLGQSFQAIGKLFKTPALLTSYTFYLSVVAWLVGGFSLRTAPSGLSAFLELLPKDTFKTPANADQDPGFRERYKREFAEIIKAAGEKRFVVFIDDVDRIDGEKIKELLECINFVADVASMPVEQDGKPARFYFVIGMSIEQVTRNLGRVLGGKEADPDGNEEHAGAQYLEKLVDLVVHVPNLKDSPQKDLEHLFIRPKASHR